MHPGYVSVWLLIRYRLRGSVFLAEGDVLDICQAGRQSVSRLGFLKTPGYPVQYPPGQQCRCNISTTAEQRVLLKFADASLVWSQGCGDDVVEVWDGETRMPRCGRLPWNYNVTSRTSAISVRFRSDVWQQDKGALIAVEGS
jgi:hypothetical protein